MPPYDTIMTNEVVHSSEDHLSTQKKAEPIKVQLIWRNIIFFIYLHFTALYGLFLMFTSTKIATAIFQTIFIALSALGVTAGAHRLWSHKAYKAKLPLRLFLIFCNTMTFQGSVINWVRDHRVHHKYSETDADPHNATRGFFFAHMGWLMYRKHPQVKEHGSKIDVSDLTSDPIIAFQHKYYLLVTFLLCFVLPTAIPMIFWNEYFTNSYTSNLSRYTVTLHLIWLVNSAAHFWGGRPYDKFINPAENVIVAILTIGEGWHNYHHTFPWDYKTSELGACATNFTAAFIDQMAKFGLAYDLKSVSKEVIQQRVERTGDGTHELWGWGDKDQTAEERKEALVTHRLKG